MDKVVYLPTDKIIIAPENPRFVVDPDEINALTENIKRTGILSPIHVIPLQKNLYGAIDGGRRLEAAKRLGLKEVPCIVHNVDKCEALKLTIALHQEHEDLTDLEMGMLYKRLLNQKIFKSKSELADFLGISDTTITYKIKLVDDIIASAAAFLNKQNYEKIGLKACSLIEKHLPEEKKREAYSYLVNISEPRLRKLVLNKLIANPQLSPPEAMVEILNEAEKPVTHREGSIIIEGVKDRITIKIKGQTLTLTLTEGEIIKKLLTNVITTLKQRAISQ
ncbi:MAG: ParB/RepB/Spo0J family partition protein [Nitrososphaerota archaeon]